MIFPVYRNMYLSTNSTARMYINGVTSFALPVASLIITYEMQPIEIPSEML